MKHIHFIIVYTIVAILLISCNTPNPAVTNGSDDVVTDLLVPTKTVVELESFPAPSNTPTDVLPTAISTPTEVLEPTKSNQPVEQAVPTTQPTQTPMPSLAPGFWQSWPVVPILSDRVNVIYQHGQELGNNPATFSKIGDCGSTPAWFLGDFDLGSDFYDLGEHTYLEPVIENFQGSFGRTSLAARSGFNASSLFVTFWTDRSQCSDDETPLACEYRLNRPAFAFIMLGSNDIFHPENFEPQMRKIIEYSIDNGIVPILSTKADNEEGDHSINLKIAQLAYEYEIPMWNFWLAVQSLPDQGLQEDNVHLTWGRNFFSEPAAMEKAWPVRNLTALQVLDAVWRKVTMEEVQ